VRLLDTPALRAQVRGGYFVEPPSQYMLRNSFKYRVHGWIKDGQTIDLGGRTVRLLSTPGHTPDSVSLVDGDGSRLFTGDIVNRIITLVGVPGSDVTAMAASLHRLLEAGHAGTVAYEAHAEAPISWLELQQVASGVAAIAAGNAAWTPTCLGGTPMRRFIVGVFPFVLPMPGGPTQPPLGSVTETIDWEGGACHWGDCPKKIMAKNVGRNTQEKRNEVLTSIALQLFAERGFLGASVKQIAHEAGVNPALIYYYYKDKADLFRAAIVHAVSSAIWGLRTSPARNGAANRKTKIQACVTRPSEEFYGIAN
jgi:hypothetical protein